MVFSSFFFKFCSNPHFFSSKNGSAHEIIGENEELIEIDKLNEVDFMDSDSDDLNINVKFYFYFLSIFDSYYFFRQKVRQLIKNNQVHLILK